LESTRRMPDVSHFPFFFLLHPPHPRSTLFPYTTLFRSNFRREEFERAVERAKEYIRSGDIFQVVLSQRFESDFTGEPLDFYRCLDRKSTRLNSSHVSISNAVFCLKKKTIGINVNAIHR